MELHRPLAGLLAALTLAACSPTAASDALQIVVSAYPLAWVAEQVAPDAEVVQLAAAGEDAHDAQLSPQEQATVQSADLVIYVGGGFQPQIEAAAQDGTGTVVAATDALPDDLSDARRSDPHVWFDPAVMGRLAEQAARALAEAQPEEGAAYERNAAEVAREMSAVASDVAALLGDCEQQQVIVGHEAYAHLLEPHGLQQFGISPAAGHSEATPQRIAELVRRIRDEQIPAVLSEVAEGRRDAELVAREAGVDVIQIASLDIVSQEQSALEYPQLLRQQAEAVAKAAECA